MDKSKHWYDSRIVYPHKDIRVTDELYIVNTELCTDKELWTLLYHSNRIKVKDQYDMMSYLRTFKPLAFEMIEKSTGKILYTPSLENFIISIHPIKPLLDADKSIIEEVAINMYEHIKQTQTNCKEVLKQTKYILNNK